MGHEYFCLDDGNLLSDTRWVRAASPSLSPQAAELESLDVPAGSYVLIGEALRKVKGCRKVGGNQIGRAHV